MAVSKVKKLSIEDKYAVLVSIKGRGLYIPKFILELAFGKSEEERDFLLKWEEGKMVITLGEK